MIKRCSALALVLASIVAAAHAGADEPTDPQTLACAVAYEQGQRLRKANRLLAARAQLVVCSDAECPGVLQEGCARWLREVDESIPSVVLVARDASGNDLYDVRVDLDGRLLVTRLDGQPLSVDPGRKTFRFVRPDGASLERRVDLAAGESARSIEVTFADAATSSRPAGDATRSAGVPTATWVLGGVGVAALLGFAYFALDGRSKKSDLDECDSACDPDEVDAARRSFLIGDVFLAVGISALAGATIVYATRPDASATGMALAVGARF